MAYSPPHSYLSIEVTADSNSSDAEYDAWDEDNFSAFTKTDHVTANGITFTQTDGRFTVDFDGIFVVMWLPIIEVSASATVRFKVTVNGGSAETHDIYVNSAVDPAQFSIVEMRNLTSGDYINCAVDSQSAGRTATVKSGGHMNILGFT